MSKAGGWKGMAIAAACLVVGVAFGALALRPGGDSTPAATAPPPEAAAPATARITLDSAPQGATVVTVQDGRRLGETPLLLELPRSQAVMEVTLTKVGFAPTPFKVIPNQDKDVVAQLEPLGASPPAPAPPVAVRRRADTPSKAATKLTTAVVPARPSAPPAPPRAPAAVAPRSVAPAAIPPAPMAPRPAVPTAASVGPRPLKPGAVR
jgi:hypothetical protein